MIYCMFWQIFKRNVHKTASLALYYERVWFSDNHVEFSLTKRSFLDDNQKYGSLTRKVVIK